MKRILVADSSQISNRMFSVGLSSHGFLVRTVSDVELLTEACKKESFDLLLLDLYLGGENQSQIVATLKKQYRDMLILVLSDVYEAEEAVSVMKNGASDFLKKPCELDRLISKIEALLLAEKLSGSGKVHQAELFETSGTAIRRIEDVVDKVKNYQTTILITGESGTGKTMLAKKIHFTSHRKEAPFIHVNCAAIPANLFESELFGYEKGAFTGAQKMKKGKFEAAGNGTIFLDEVGLIPIHLQSKLLNVLQEKVFERVGGNEVIPMEARIIAATNANLEQCVEAGTFRSDLYYRLNVIQLEMPPLRYRKEDLRSLTIQFINRFCSNFGREVPEIDSSFWDLVMNYQWPGNIRELENAVESAVALCGTCLDGNCLPLRVGQMRGASTNYTETQIPHNLRMYLKQQEEVAILAALDKFNGQKEKTAQYLGISDRTLRYKLSNMGRYVSDENDEL